MRWESSSGDQRVDPLVVNPDAFAPIAVVGRLRAQHRHQPPNSKRLGCACAGEPARYLEIPEEASAAMFKILSATGSYSTENTNADSQHIWVRLRIDIMQELTITGTSRNEASSLPATKAGRRPLHEMLTPFPFAYFTAALLTDIAYWRSDEVMWERFAVWLITGGLVMSALLAIVAIIDLIGGKQKPAGLRVLTYVVAVLVALFNVLIHSRDGYTAVVPTGMTLSAVVFVIMLAAISGGWALSHRRLGAKQ